ncbi:stage II sporulation protein B [Paenibacillus tianmuensis]|uniref:Stage II sporulation protein B n=1 Tax=Paenibacillus tianmuensis TaxID=624147 RepID=A0A1G4QNU3_9BACL|nr:hypothetical protein [Paenibacillus tianmuensis]SCW46280.1 stage II sporulation protein B [Paenibacillus tianmuensis]
MNKTKMTFRFHKDGQRQERQDTGSGSQVIPLRAEEYTVVEQPADESRKESDKPPVENGKIRGSMWTGPALNEYTTDFGGWQSSFETETHRVEQLIRESGGGRSFDPETGYVERPVSTSGMERTHRPYTQEESAYFRRTHGNGSWIRITASVAGAVVTGVAFGFLVLSMFSGGTDSGKTTSPGSMTTAQQGTKGAGAGGTASTGETTGKTGAEGSAAPASGSAIGVAVQIPAKSYAVLQGGVFSSAQGAEAAAADFRKKGLAGAVDEGDKHPVYVGMAGTRDEALGLSQAYQQKNIEVIVKTLDLPAVTKIKWNGKQADVFSNYIAQGDKLVKLIAAQTISHAADAKPEALDDKVLQSIKTTHQSWSQTAATVSDGLGEAGKKALPKMNNSLNTAVASFEEYKKNPSQAFLWQAQTAAMQYIVAEKELLKAVALS